MNTERLNLFMQGATLVSIIVGASLVIYELRQTALLTQTQIASDIGSLIMARRYSEFGENIAQTLERACFEPDSMSRQDAVLLDVYFDANYALVQRFKSGPDIAGLSTNWRALGRGGIQSIYSYPQGKRWLQQRVERNAHSRFGSTREIALFVSEVISEPPWMSCDEEINVLMPADSP